MIYVAMPLTSCLLIFHLRHAMLFLQVAALLELSLAAMKITHIRYFCYYTPCRHAVILPMLCRAPCSPPADAARRLLPLRYAAYSITIFADIAAATLRRLSLIIDTPY